MPQTQPGHNGVMAENALTGSFTEVLKVFTRLDLTSFGGPVAHLGYFHDEFVKRRGWLDEASYADLVALCQFLPGPASSSRSLSAWRWSAWLVVIVTVLLAAARGALI